MTQRTERWIPAFAGMTGVSPALAASGAHVRERNHALVAVRCSTDPRRRVILEAIDQYRAQAGLARSVEFFDHVRQEHDLARRTLQLGRDPPITRRVPLVPD